MITISKKKGMAGKTILWLLLHSLILAAFALCANSQSTVPPPPPVLIWKAPNPSEIKVFKSNLNHFSAEFAGEVDAGDGIGVLSHYIAKRPGSLTYVRVIQLTAEDLKNPKFESTLDEIKAVYGRKAGYRIIDDKKIDPFTIEFSATNGQSFRRVKAMRYGPTIYEMYVDVVNWPILRDLYKERVEEFNREVDRFFNSFKVLK